MAIEPVTHLERYIAGTVEPVTHLEKVIEQYGGGGGGGGSSVTPASIVTATGQMTDQQAAQTRENLNASPAATVITVEGTTPTITPIHNRIYNCGELTALTISNPPATGAYSVTFTSGSTPTDLSIDPAIKMPDGFSVEANKRYEINVLNRWAVVGSWAVSV